MPRDLTTLRHEISSIDHEILDLLSRRMILSSEVAEYKMSAGLPIYDSVREKEMIEHYWDRVDFDISRIYTEIMAESKRLQETHMKQKNPS
jgi:chorismate mutase